MASRRFDYKQFLPDSIPEWGNTLPAGIRGHHVELLDSVVETLDPKLQQFVRRLPEGEVIEMLSYVDYDDDPDSIEDLIKYKASVRNPAYELSDHFDDLGEDLLGKDVFPIVSYPENPDHADEFDEVIESEEDFDEPIPEKEPFEYAFTPKQPTYIADRIEKFLKHETPDNRRNWLKKTDEEQLTREATHNTRKWFEERKEKDRTRTDDISKTIKQKLERKRDSSTEPKEKPFRNRRNRL